MKLLKKGVSIILALGIVAVTLIVPNAVYALTEANRIISESFDDNTFSYAVDSFSTANAEVVKLSDNPNYDTSLSFANGAELKEYMYGIRKSDSDNDAFNKDAWVTNGTQGAYTVTSFDIAPYNVTARGLYVKLMNFKADKAHAQLSFQNEKIYLYKLIDGTSTAVHIGGYSNKEMINVRIVMDMTADVLHGVFIDGENVLSEGETIGFLNPNNGDAYSKIEITYTNKTADESSTAIGCYFDNLHITNYFDKKAALSGEGVQLYKYKINNAKIITSEEAVIVENVELAKHSADKTKCSVVLASYDEEGLIDCAIKAESMIKGKDTTLFLLDFEIPANAVVTKIFAWTDECVPLCEYTIPSQSLKTWTITVNGNVIALDVPPYKNHKGEIIVPVKNIVNHLGYDFIDNKNGSYTVDGFDHGSLTLTVDSEVASSDKSEVSITTPYLYEDVLLMAPLSVIEWAFGVDVAIDEENNTLAVTGKALSFWPTSLFTGIDIEINEASQFSADYVISGVDSNAALEIYYKDAVYYSDRIESVCYHRAVTPVKDENGKWHGGIGNLRQNHHYDILLKITKNGTVSYYEKKKAVKTIEVQSYSYEDFVGTDEFKLVPTFENIGYYITSDAQYCAVEYRKFGEEEWKNAYAPYSDPYVSQFRGSIVGLESGTEYEVKATLTAVDGTKTEKTLNTATWSEEPNITKTIDVSEIYDGSGSLNISGYKGADNGWIRITNKNNIVVTGDSNCNDAVLVNDCEYLIIDGLKVRGGYNHGILLTASVSNVRISNCDISQFGHPGIYSDESGFYMLDGAYIDYNAGIFTASNSGIVIENCYIHDSSAVTNKWDNGILSKKHPHGSTGILYNQSRNCVIRNNTIVGNEGHMWNDGIECGSNHLYQGGACSDTDIYGNTIKNCNDDGVELDGGQMNIRFYNNRIDNTYKGISITPNMAGPTYIYNNLITNAYGGIKAGGGGTGEGMMTMGQTYLFGNTVLSNVSVIGNTGIGTYGVDYHIIALNNIFISDNGYAFYDSGHYDSISDENPKLYDRIENNILVGNVGKGYDEADNIIAEPKFVSTEDYKLKEDSAGYRSALWIDNFNESSTKDIGVCLPD